MKIDPLTTFLVVITTVGAIAVPDARNGIALHEFKKRIFSCPFQCDVVKALCVVGESAKEAFLNGQAVSANKPCRCGRIIDEPRCASKCGWKC